MKKTLDKFPELLMEFHPKKNGNLKPNKITHGSDRRIWWICAQGHEWKTAVYHRTSGPKSSCPYCSNRKVSKENNLSAMFPIIAKEWHPTKNGNTNPSMYLPGISKKVWWKCEKNHEWEAKIYHRTGSKSNCPYCKGQVSKPEYKILSELSTIFNEVELRDRSTKIEIDLFIRDINFGIEYDGWYFHKGCEKKDKKKMRFCKKKALN